MPPVVAGRDSHGPQRAAWLRYRSPLLDLPGAVPARDAESGVAAHYGDPIAEQYSIMSGVGVADRSHWALFVVSGEHHLSWLDGLSAQRLVDLPPFRAREALMLFGEGYVEDYLFVTELGDRSWIATVPQNAASLFDHLTRHLPQAGVRLADVTSKWASLLVMGPEALGVLRALGVGALPEPAAVESLAGGGWLWWIPFPRRISSAGLVVPRGLLRHAVRRLTAAGARPVGTEATDALRVEGLRPRLAVDTDDRTLPQEVGWMVTGVDPGKTGYPGWEAVARVTAAGRPPRRIVRLRLEGPDEPLPPHRVPVLRDAQPVGFVGATAVHHRMGPVALALVDSAVPDGAVVTAGGRPARIEPRGDSTP